MLFSFLAALVIHFSSFQSTIELVQSIIVYLLNTFVHSNVQSNLENYLIWSFNRRLVSRSILLVLEWQSFNIILLQQLLIIDKY
jgi:hypothetical protein